MVTNVFGALYDIFQNARLVPEGYIKLILVCKLGSVFPYLVYSESTIKVEHDFRKLCNKKGRIKIYIIKEVDESSTLKTLMSNIDKMSDLVFHETVWKNKFDFYKKNGNGEIKKLRKIINNDCTQRSNKFAKIKKNKLTLTDLFLR